MIFNICGNSLLLCTSWFVNMIIIHSVMSNINIEKPANSAFFRNLELKKGSLSTTLDAVIPDITSKKTNIK